MRVNGWQRALNEYLVEAQAKYAATGIVYGDFDCCTFAADWVVRCIGIDPMAEYRGKYSTEAEARLLVPSLLEVLAAKLGPPIHAVKAQRGDIAFHDGLQTVGVFFTSGGRMNALFPSEHGFTMPLAKDISHAFRIE